MRFKTVRLTVIRNKPKQTISASGGLGLLQMVLEPDIGMTPKGVDCEIPHRLERETKHYKGQWA